MTLLAVPSYSVSIHAASFAPRSLDRHANNVGGGCRLIGIALVRFATGITTC